ncbi:MAG TPA: hypothetical protein PKE55_10550 [Kiritimatiellia bacterium]|nr:hypothetical protein [Kiritimatiellia bacterium]
MKSIRHLVPLLLASLLLPSLPLHAHHAMEFIETESYTTLGQGEFLFYVQYDYLVEDKNDPDADRWEITPGMAYGLTDRLMIDAHVHFAKFGNNLIEEEFRETYAPNGPSPFLEALALTAQYRLTDNAPINVAISGTLEVPFSRARDLLDATEVYEAKLILSRDFGNHGNITLNLGWSVEGSEDESAVALGIKHPLTSDPHGPSAGLEWLFDPQDLDDSWTLLPGLYLPISSSGTILKTGFEIGKNADTVRASVALMKPF